MNNKYCNRVEQKTGSGSHQPGFKSRSGRGFFSSIRLAGMVWD